MLVGTFHIGSIEIESFYFYDWNKGTFLHFFIRGEGVELIMSPCTAGYFCFIRQCPTLLPCSGKSTTSCVKQNQAGSSATDCQELALLLEADVFSLVAWPAYLLWVIFKLSLLHPISVFLPLLPHHLIAVFPPTLSRSLSLPMHLSFTSSPPDFSLSVSSCSRVRLSVQ